MSMTTVVALEPYKTEDAPLRISILEILSNANNLKSSMLEVAPVTFCRGIPSISMITFASLPPLALNTLVSVLLLKFPEICNPGTCSKTSESVCP